MDFKMALQQVCPENIPKHVGVIPDGNRRWAEVRGLTHIEGHQAGYEKFKCLIRWAKEFEIEYLTIYTLSDKNFKKRDKEEIDFLMEILLIALTEEIPKLHEENIRVCFIGDFAVFSEDIQDQIQVLNLEAMKSHDAEMTLCIALNYGGREEICHATYHVFMNRPGNDAEGAPYDYPVKPEELERFLWTRQFGIPDLDLLIRTSGERRLSGFLLWQIDDAELSFPKTLWPAYSKSQFREIVRENFPRRKRRFGK